MEHPIAMGGPSSADGRGAEGGPLLALTDEEAMRRVQEDGDERAFGLVLRRWQEPIRRLCTRMTGDAHRAEELAQEAFARLFEQAGSYRHGARLSTFLWRIAVNLCLDERRRAGSRPVQPLSGAAEAVLAAGVARPDAVASRRERAEHVRQALGRLPEHYRAVVVLRHYEGLKFREIAEVLDIPEGTVKSRMAVALDKLSAMLRPVLGEA